MYSECNESNVSLLQKKKKTAPTTMKKNWEDWYQKSTICAKAKHRKKKQIENFSSDLDG